MLPFFLCNLKSVYVFNNNCNESKIKSVNSRWNFNVLITIFLTTFLMKMAIATENKYFFTSELCTIFTSNFYKITAKEVDKNIISSPISIHLLLSYISHGARGQTADELKNSLSINDLKQLSNDYKDLISTLNAVQDAELHVANSAYLHINVDLLPEFSTIGKDFYNFAVSNIDFKDNKAASDQINQWVMEKTKNKISDIISSDDITEDTALILMNAIYFKGAWKYPFDRSRTSDKLFYVSKNQYKIVPTMTKTHRYTHGELPELNARFIVLPYTSEDLNMVIILPNEIDGLSDLERNFDWSLVRSAESRTREVILRLPRFKIESTLDLKSILNKIGIKTMFENSADFGGMTEKLVKVSKVIHKAFLEVNEEGCEAAAATVAQIRLRRAIMEEEFTIDRPFIVSIRHKHSDMPLFIGSIRDVDINAPLMNASKDEF